MGALVEFRDVRPQAPIMRRDPEKPIVHALCVFAAGRQSFDVIVRRLVLQKEALALIFDMLPMEDNGWDKSFTEITRAGTSTDKWPIWRITRG